MKDNLENPRKPKDENKTKIKSPLISPLQPPLKFWSIPADFLKV
jgi:hypothetical protein